MFHMMNVVFTFGLIFLSIQSTFGEITPEESSAIDQVRNRLGDILYKDYMKTDGYILPWLKARGMSVEAAIEMIKKSHKWRIQNQMDTILNSKEGAKCDSFFPVFYDSVDRQGRPILLLNLAEWDVRKHILAGRQEQFLRCSLRNIERMNGKIRKMHAVNKGMRNVTQWVFIADLKGYNMRQHACVGCITTYINAVVSYEANYPQAIYKMFLLNTPSFFDALLQLAKSVMSEETRNSLNVYGFNQAEWKAVLQRDIDPDQLTTMYGGTRKHQPGTG